MSDIAEETAEKTEYLSTTQILDLFPISMSTVHRHIKSGQLKSLKFGGKHLITRAALAEFLKLSNPNAEVILEQTAEDKAASKRMRERLARRA